MNRDTKRILFWLVIAAVIIGSFLLIMFAGKGGTDTAPSNNAMPAVEADEHIKGNPDAKVDLVEYSDFQCPACKSREPIVESIVQEFGSHIRFVYRNFPLRSIHQNAQLSAQAGEAAALQGKFWEMHGKLFEKQEDWAKMSRSQAEDAFISYAQEIGLDTTKFENDLNSSAVERAVNEDYEGGIDARVDSTPSFFLNGKFIDPKSLDEFRTMIRAEISSAETINQ